jgi:hypothetical protein
LKHRSVFARARFFSDAKQNGISEAVDALAHRKNPVAVIPQNYTLHS